MYYGIFILFKFKILYISKFLNTSLYFVSCLYFLLMCLMENKKISWCYSRWPPKSSLVLNHFCTTFRKGVHFCLVNISSHICIWNLHLEFQLNPELTLQCGLKEVKEISFSLTLIVLAPMYLMKYNNHPMTASPSSWCINNTGGDYFYKQLIKFHY